MTEEEKHNPIASSNDAVLDQQYLRALSSFEGILLAQMEVKNTLGDRLNISIRAGLVILGVLAISICILLIMLSSQFNRITGVVADMNQRMYTISSNVEHVRANMKDMENQVALMEEVELYTTIMTQEVDAIASDMAGMEQSVSRINGQFSQVRHRINSIAKTVTQMNSEVQGMQHGVSRMSQPARMMNNFFPFMP